MRKPTKVVLLQVCEGGTARPISATYGLRISASIYVSLCIGGASHVFKMVSQAVMDVHAYLCIAAHVRHIAVVYP